MVDEPTITSEEVELLSQEGELLAKKEQEENLESEEEETLGKINSLKEELKERFKEKEIPQKTKEEILSLQAQKEHFRTKFGKEKEEKEKLLKELEVAKKKAPPEEKTDWQQKVDFLLTNKDTSREEFEFISAIAKGKGISLEDAVSSKEVQEFINFQRKKVEEEKSKLEPSTKISPSEKSFEKITPEDLDRMSLKEKEEVLKKKGWIKERR